MTEITHLMQKIHRFMEKDDSYYLLSRSRDFAPETWEAAQSLVDLGVARWLPNDSNYAPGIVLTGRPLP